jgi:hypothetical protein
MRGAAGLDAAPRAARGAGSPQAAHGADRDALAAKHAGVAWTAGGWAAQRLGAGARGQSAMRRRAHTRAGAAAHPPSGRAAAADCPALASLLLRSESRREATRLAVERGGAGSSNSSSAGSSGASADALARAPSAASSEGAPMSVPTALLLPHEPPEAACSGGSAGAGQLAAELSAPDDAGAARHQDQCDSPARSARARGAKPAGGVAAIAAARSSAVGSSGGGLGGGPRSPAKRAGGSPARASDQGGRRRPPRGDGPEAPSPPSPLQLGDRLAARSFAGERGADAGQEDQAPPAFATPLAATPPPAAAPEDGAARPWPGATSAGGDEAFLTPCGAVGPSPAGGASGEEQDATGGGGEAGGSAARLIGSWRASPAATSGAHRYGSPGVSADAAASSAAGGSGTQGGASTVALTEAASASLSVAATVSVSASGVAAAGAPATPDGGDGAQSRLLAEQAAGAQERLQPEAEAASQAGTADCEAPGSDAGVAGDAVTPKAAGGLAGWLRPAMWLQAAAAAAAAGARAVPAFMGSPAGSTGSAAVTQDGQGGAEAIEAGAAGSEADAGVAVDAGMTAAEAGAAEAEARAAEVGGDAGAAPLGADAVRGLLSLDGPSDGGADDDLLSFGGALAGNRADGVAPAPPAAAHAPLWEALGAGSSAPSAAASPEPRLPPLAAESSGDVAALLGAQQTPTRRGGAGRKAPAPPSRRAPGGSATPPAPPSAGRGSAGNPQALTPTKETCMGVRLTRAQVLQQQRRRSTAGRGGGAGGSSGGGGSGGSAAATGASGGRAKPPRRLTMPGATGPGQQQRRPVPPPPRPALARAAGPAGVDDAPRPASAGAAAPARPGQALARGVSIARSGSLECRRASCLDACGASGGGAVEATEREPRERQASYVELLQAQYGERGCGSR